MYLLYIFYLFSWWDFSVVMRIGQVLVPGGSFPTAQLALESLTAAEEKKGSIRLEVSRFCPEFPAAEAAAK